MSGHHLLAAPLLGCQPEEKNLEIWLITFRKLIVIQSLLTPFKAPATTSDTLICVEKDVDSLSDAGKVGNLGPLPTSSFTVVHIVCGSKMSQQGAVPISYFKVIDLIRTLQLVIGEVDVDDTSFGNLDAFPLVKIIRVGEGEVRRTLEYLKSI